MKPKPIPPQFLARELPPHSVVDGGCWKLRRSPGAGGYTNIYMKIDGRLVRVPAHRLFYRKLVGPIPNEHPLDHLCRNRWCVRPRCENDPDGHTEPVSQRENVMRSLIAPAAINARKTRCNAGHELSGENLRLAAGRRVCKTCTRERYRNVYAAERKQRRLAPCPIL